MSGRRDIFAAYGGENVHFEWDGENVLESLVAAPAWFADAACRGVAGDLMFPGRGEDSAEAKQICAGCSVREPCLDFAIENRETHGVWGGLSERQRRNMRRRVHPDTCPNGHPNSERSPTTGRCLICQVKQSRLSRVQR